MKSKESERRQSRSGKQIAAGVANATAAEGKGWDYKITAEGVRAMPAPLVRFEMWMPVPSLNVWERMHWSNRGGIRKRFLREVMYHAMMGECETLRDKKLRSSLKWPLAFRFTQLVGKDQNEYDDENFLSVAHKIIVDAFKNCKLIPNDTKRYIRACGTGETEFHPEKRCSGVRVEVFGS